MSLNLTKHASRFQLAVGLPRGYTVVQFSREECGLYLKHFRNDFGTSLALRGSRMEVEAYVAEVLS